MLSQNMNVTLRRLRLGSNPGIETAAKAFMGCRFVHVMVREVRPGHEEDGEEERAL